MRRRSSIRREALLLLAPVAGTCAAAVARADLTPRVRASEAITVSAGALGGGAAFVPARLEYRHARPRTTSSPR